MTDIEAIQQDLRELTLRVALVEDKLDQELKAKAEARAALLRIAAKRNTKKRGTDAKPKKFIRNR